MKFFTVLLFGMSFLVPQLNAQTCGFGCLGLSGFYGGYTQQFYNLQGLNEHVSQKLNTLNFLDSEMTFDRGKGVRIGANIFRAQFEDYFFTAKGFYQFLKEEQNFFTNYESSPAVYNSTIRFNYWGIGLDFGIPLFSIVNWKIVEGGVTFYKSSFENSLSVNNNIVFEERYEEEKIKVGYFVGTGLVIHFIRDYVSLEGSAVYNMVQIDNLIDDQGNYLLDPDSDTKLMEKAGISATIQLNIGVPL